MTDMGHTAFAKFRLVQNSGQCRSIRYPTAPVRVDWVSARSFTSDPPSLPRGCVTGRCFQTRTGIVACVLQFAARDSADGERLRIGSVQETCRACSNALIGCREGYAYVPGRGVAVEVSWRNQDPPPGQVVN
jgi:hypothetical protein